MYTYDKKGNEIEYCTFDRDSILNNKITKVYDKKGNIIETCEYVKSELTRKQSTKYDTKGRMIEFYYFVKEKGYVIYPGKLTDVDTFRIGNIGEIYEEDIHLLCDIIEQYMGVLVK